MAKHDKTLKAIFDKPTRANLEWRDIESLLAYLGATITEGRGSRVRITLNDVNAVFHRPHPRKDAGKGCVEAVRDFLEHAGVGPCGGGTMMEYKGYTGQIIGMDEDQGFIHGRVADIIDVITFEGRTFDEVRQAFHDSVEDYLDFCTERQQPPEKPFSGRFLVRIPAELHRQATLAAKRSRQSLNAWVAAALESRVQTERTGRDLRKDGLPTNGREHTRVKARELTKRSAKDVGSRKTGAAN